MKKSTEQACAWFPFHVMARVFVQTGDLAAVLTKTKVSDTLTFLLDSTFANMCPPNSNILDILFLLLGQAELGFK